MCPVADFDEPMIDARLLAFLDAGEAVEAESDGQTEEDDDIKLEVDRCTELVAQVPCSYYKKVEQDFCCCSSHMREVEVKQEMVEVGLIRVERRSSSQDTCSHDPEGVEDRDNQKSKIERNHSEVFRSEHRNGRV